MVSSSLFAVKILLEICCCVADFSADSFEACCAAYIYSHISRSDGGNCECVVCNVNNIACNSVDVLSVGNIVKCSAAGDCYTCEAVG